MPFEGARIVAPIMAAKQGMMDAALHGVTDKAQSVVKYVTGSVTGKGSGLLQPVTQAAQSAMQSSMTQAKQAGQSMTLGAGELWGAGQTTGSSGDTWQSALSTLESGGGGAASLVGAMAGGGGGGLGSLASAQSAMRQTSGLGSAAALAGSVLGSGTGSGAGVGSAGASAGAGAAGLSGSSPTLPAGLAPGTQATPPQFNALPDIPSMPRLQDVISRLGAMAGPAAAPLLQAFGSGGAGGDDTGSGMQAPVTNQIAGKGGAADSQADS